jgi:hypothetical protein
MTQDELLALVGVSVLVFLPVIVVPVVLHFRHERWKLTLEHERQLRALDLGRTMPGRGDRESWFSPIRVGLIIGAGVPLGAFICAMVTSIAAGFQEATWIATCIVGLGAVISGAVIAGRGYSESQTSPGAAEEKPIVDEDAYDVVSARG